jgi:hypothetical protein
MDEANALSEHYGKPVKQSDGKWWYLDKNGFPAAELIDEREIARLEAGLLQFELNVLRKQRANLNILEDKITQQKNALDHQIDETITKLYAIR